MKKIIISVLAVLLAVPLIGFAAEFRSGNQVSLTGGAGDQYAAGGNVTASGDVQGDLIIAGGTVSVSASTTESILVAGGTIMVRGQVGDDIRAAGGNIMISSAVKNDIVVVGGQVTLDQTAVAGGDAILAGGTVSVDGAVRGKVRISGGQVVLNGIIDRDVSIRADKLTIGEKAVISGNVDYSSPSKAEIKTGSQVKGTVNYTPITRAERATGRAEGITPGSVIGWLLGGFFMAFVSAWAIYMVFRRPTVLVVDEVLGSFWKSVLIGLVALIVTPIAALILCITFLGLPLGIMAFFSYVAILILSFVLAPVVFGSMAYRWITRTNTLTVDWQTIALGVFSLMIISLIPIIGWLVKFIVMLAVLGAIVRRGYGKLAARTAKPAVIEPAAPSGPMQ